MPKSMDIQVHHITRVEGHGDIAVRVRDGAIEKVEWQVPEAPRFFEAMVRGRNWDDIQTVVSRICGICSVTHSLAAVKAIESAMGIAVSPQTEQLRLLTQEAEQLESHSLHVGYLVAPDLLGVKSVVPLAASHPDLVKTVIGLHRLGNQWMALLAGRMTHPVTIMPGGFSRLPSEIELRDLQSRLQQARPELQKLAEAVLSVAGKLPNLQRDTEFVALVEPKTYALYYGAIGSTDTRDTVSVQQFESVVNEYVSPQSTAKWAKWHRDTYMVGALARYNLTGEYLLAPAKKLANQLGLKKGVCNPYHNNLAQIVECLQSVEHALEIIDGLLTAGIKPERARVRPRAGEGAGAVEAPRGILFHRYIFDADGKCVKANMTIPTNQNHANIQKDMEAFLPQILERGQDEVRQVLEMLVRAYDPCISCSTHLLDIKFV